MWFFNFQIFRQKRHRNRNALGIYVLWILTFSQLFTHSLGFFFPMFGNFFNKFNRGNGNHHHDNHHFNNGVNGGVSLFSGGNGAGGNATLIRVPMLHTVPERRVDLVTTVINHAARDEPQIEVLSNVSTTAAAEALLSSKLVVPTSTSVTSSVSVGHPKPVLNHRSSSSLTLPFTPNLFGMMSYVQALKDIKRNYKVQEKERKIEFLNKEGENGDLMTRVLRTLIQKVVNKYQKGTEILKLKILKRQNKLQKFLQLPMVAGVIASEQAAAISGRPVALGKDGVSIVAAVPSGKRVPSILDSFLI